MASGVDNSSSRAEVQSKRSSGLLCEGQTAEWLFRKSQENQIGNIALNVRKLDFDKVDAINQNLQFLDDFSLALKTAQDSVERKYCLNESEQLKKLAESLPGNQSEIKIESINVQNYCERSHSAISTRLGDVNADCPPVFTPSSYGAFASIPQVKSCNMIEFQNLKISIIEGGRGCELSIDYAGEDYGNADQELENFLNLFKNLIKEDNLHEPAWRYLELNLDGGYKTKVFLPPQNAFTQGMRVVCRNNQILLDPQIMKQLEGYGEYLTISKIQDKINDFDLYKDSILGKNALSAANYETNAAMSMLEIQNIIDDISICRKNLIKKHITSLAAKKISGDGNFPKEFARLSAVIDLLLLLNENDAKVKPALEAFREKLKKILGCLNQHNEESTYYYYYYYDSLEFIHELIHDFFNTHELSLLLEGDNFSFLREELLTADIQILSHFGPAIPEIIINGNAQLEFAPEQEIEDIASPDEDSQDEQRFTQNLCIQVYSQKDMIKIRNLQRNVSFEECSEVFKKVLSADMINCRVLTDYGNSLSPQISYRNTETIVKEMLTGALEFFYLENRKYVEEMVLQLSVVQKVVTDLASDAPQQNVTNEQSNTIAQYFRQNLGLNSENFPILKEKGFKLLAGAFVGIDEVETRIRSMMMHQCDVNVAAIAMLAKKFHEKESNNADVQELLSGALAGLENSLLPYFSESIATVLLHNAINQQDSQISIDELNELQVELANFVYFILFKKDNHDLLKSVPSGSEDVNNAHNGSGVHLVNQSSNVVDIDQDSYVPLEEAEKIVSDLYNLKNKLANVREECAALRQEIVEFGANPGNEPRIQIAGTEGMTVETIGGKGYISKVEYQFYLAKKEAVAAALTAMQEHRGKLQAQLEHLRTAKGLLSEMANMPINTTVVKARIEPFQPRPRSSRLSPRAENK